METTPTARRCALLAAAVLGLGACCVAAGTLVDTPRGRVLIESLAVGDAVWSVDPATGRAVAAMITAVRRARRECVLLETDDGARLACTSDHPLYDPVAREWASAGDWALGRRDALARFTGESLEPARVTLAGAFAGVYDVYDLTVDGEHHDFVAAGLLVHNKPPPEVTNCRPTPCMCPSGQMSQIYCRDPGPMLGRCDCPDGGTDAGADASDDGVTDAGGG